MNSIISWPGWGWIVLILFGLIILLVGVVVILGGFYFLFIKLPSYVYNRLQNKKRLLRKVRKLDQNIDKLSDNKIHHYLASIYEILETLYGRSTTSKNDGYGYYEDKTNHVEFPEVWVECKILLEKYQLAKADLSTLKRDAKKTCEILLN